MTVPSSIPVVSAPQLSTPPDELTRLLTTETVCVANNLGMEAALRQTWRTFKSAGWDFALLVAEAQASAVFLQWGYTSLAKWAHDILGFDSDSAIYRFARLGSFLRSLENAEEQRRWLAAPVYHAMEALPLAKHQPQAALQIVEHARTQRQVRDAVQAADPDQHHDTSGWATVSARITQDTLHEWQRAMNVLRVNCGINGSQYPTDDEVIHWTAVLVLQAPEMHMPDEYRIDVESGTAKCHYPTNLALRHECGGYGRLQRHHLLPKSHQGHHKATAWLCAKHHEWVTQNHHGFGWREFARYLGYPDIAETPP